MTTTLQRPAAPAVPVARTVKTAILPALLPGVVMLVLGLLDSAKPVLSWDEIATADAAHRSVAQLWLLAHHIDGVFLPYYLVMHVWTALFGASVLALRLPSIIAMAGAAALTGELGRRRFGSAIGIVAGSLLCCIPNISRYAAEARPYAAACLFATLALLLLYRAVEAPSRGRWLAYACAVLAIGLCHVVALTTLAAHLLIVLRYRRRSCGVWAAAVVTVLLLLSPLFWWGIHQRPAQLHWVTPLTIGGVYAFPSLVTGTPETAWLLVGLVLIAAVGRTRRTAELAAAVTVPPVIILIVAAIGPSFWVNRYLLFVLMPAAVLGAATLVSAARGPRRWVTLAAAMAVIVAAALPGQLAVRKPTVKNGSDYRTVARVIERRQQPGDVIAYSTGRTLRTGVGYYLRGDAGRPRDILMRESPAADGTLTAEEYPDPAARLTAPRVWLVVFGPEPDPLAGRPDLASTLKAHYRRIGLWTAKNARWALYVRR